METNERHIERMGPQSVDGIAAGYEWLCPVCGEHNDEISWPEIVSCRHCKRSFETNPPEHCLGDTIPCPTEPAELNSPDLLALKKFILHFSMLYTEEQIDRFNYNERFNVVRDILQAHDDE